MNSHTHKVGEDTRQRELLQLAETGIVVTATESAAEQQLPVTIPIQLVVDRHMVDAVMATLKCLRCSLVVWCPTVCPFPH